MEVVLSTGSYTGWAWLGERFLLEVMSTLYILGDLGSATQLRNNTAKVDNLSMVL